MRIQKQNITGILMQASQRQAGEALINGKTISWDAADIIAVIQLEDPKVKLQKFKIQPGKAQGIYARLNEVCWGTLVELEFDGTFVTNVTVLQDWLSDYYATQEQI